MPGLTRFRIVRAGSSKYSTWRFDTRRSLSAAILAMPTSTSLFSPFVRRWSRAVKGLQGGVEGLVDGMAFGVGGRFDGVWINSFRFMNGRAAGFGFGGEFARANQCQERGAVGRAFLRLERDDRLRQNIGEQLAPEGAARAASGEAHGTDRNAQLFDDLEAIFLAVGNPFDQRTDEIGARVTGGEADPSTARGGVQVRRALAHQVGQPVEALRAGRGY